MVFFYMNRLGRFGMFCLLGGNLTPWRAKNSPPKNGIQIWNPWGFWTYRLPNTIHVRRCHLNPKILAKEQVFPVRLPNTETEEVSFGPPKHIWKPRVWKTRVLVCSDSCHPCFTVRVIKKKRWSNKRTQIMGLLHAHPGAGKCRIFLP